MYASRILRNIGFSGLVPMCKQLSDSSMMSISATLTMASVSAYYVRVKCFMPPSCHIVIRVLLQGDSCSSL